jgi:SiaC family regulatory phosphoprotein
MVLYQIEQTESTPLIILTNKTLEIKGEIRPEYSRNFFLPLFEALEKLQTNAMIVDCSIIFVSSSSILQLKKLFNFIKNMEGLTIAEVQWNTEDNDDEMVEIGQYLAELTDLKFSFTAV